MKHLLKINKKILHIILLLLIPVFFIELIYGNWQYHYNFKRIEKLGIFKNFQVNYKIDHLYDFESEIIEYTRDTWGLRGASENIKDIDILVIGGSTTDQRYISDADTYDQVLENEFKKNGKNIKVANAGNSAHSSYAFIKYFDLWFPNVPNLNPKYYLFLIGDNDFLRFKDDLRDKLIVNNLKFSPKRFLKERSILYTLIRKVKYVFSESKGRTIFISGQVYVDFSLNEWVNKPKFTNHEFIQFSKKVNYQNNLKNYENNLIILINKIKSLGGIPIFVTESKRRAYTLVENKIYGIPSDNSSLSIFGNPNINGVDYFYMMKLLHESTKDISNKKGAIFIDLSDLEFDLRKDFWNVGHNTPTGNLKKGKYLYTKLEKIISK